MPKGSKISIQPVRDGIEGLPEMEDLSLELPADQNSADDRFVEEALLESFPASDPPASGKLE